MIRNHSIMKTMILLPFAAATITVVIPTKMSGMTISAYPVRAFTTNSLVLVKGNE